MELMRRSSSAAGFFWEQYNVTFAGFCHSIKDMHRNAVKSYRDLPLERPAPSRGCFSSFTTTSSPKRGKRGRERGREKREPEPVVNCVHLLLARTVCCHLAAATRSW